MPRPGYRLCPNLRSSKALKNYSLVGSGSWRISQTLSKGLDSRFRGQTPTGAAAVQAAWYDGFGGMGKSWFLRKVKLETERRLLPQAKVALIDWYLPALRSGLLMPPAEPRELFGAVADRLGQLYGVEALDPYWIAAARVSDAAADHQKVIRRFQRGLTEWTKTRSGTLDSAMIVGGKQEGYVQEQKDYLLKDVLVKEGLWSDNPSETRAQHRGSAR